jgi:RNA polymerase sigma factor (sigma-70 family)
MSNQITASLALPAPATAPGLAASAEAVFEAFYRAAWPRVYAFVRIQVRERQTAADIVGRVFLKAYIHRKDLPSESESMRWIFRIAHNALIDYWRVQGRREAVLVSIDELQHRPSPAASPEDVYATKERQALLIRIMGELDQADRTLLALKFAAQRTNREIAHILDASEGAVSMRLLRALRRLRRRLREFGL